MPGSTISLDLRHRYAFRWHLPQPSTAMDAIEGRWNCGSLTSKIVRLREPLAVSLCPFLFIWDTERLVAPVIGF